MSTTTLMNELPSRAALRNVRRVCIKAGTSVVANEDGRASLTRLGAIAEQIAELTRDGVQVIFVSSGAVGIGKRVLRKQGKMNMTVMDLTHAKKPNEQPLLVHSSSAHLLNSDNLGHTEEEKQEHYSSACAAAGQLDMMNLYSSLFAQVDVDASQILVTQADFANKKSVGNLTYAVERLLDLGIVPIINENDAVSGGFTDDDMFSDNDSLAALCARFFGAEALLLLTDVDGVYDSSPKENPEANLLSFYNSESKVLIGSKSSQGRGGMNSKIEAAMSSVAPGSKCLACVVTGGSDLNAIRSILGPNPKFGQKGTLFVTPGTDLGTQAYKDAMADEVRKLHCLTSILEMGHYTNHIILTNRKASPVPPEKRRLLLATRPESC
jgi:delta-1-pyrroline-5-carboxylate synthetase